MKKEQCNCKTFFCDVGCDVCEERVMHLLCVMSLNPVMMCARKVMSLWTMSVKMQIQGRCNFRFDLKLWSAANGDDFRDPEIVPKSDNFRYWIPEIVPNLP